ncbi:hypothetical protein SDC9_187297 [bioreactor metagenome]|uniref:Uncharacterized protein n=1 Tax=bioreactor metagenome TaxID=1076179 RepID=A0A645HLA0_9ZZZZ
MYLIDVDFDGTKDILVQNGHYGNQGFVEYACFLFRAGEYVICDSFTAIPNVAVDAKNKVILGCWRNWAASHSYAMYSCINDEFVMTNKLTEEPLDTSDNSGEDATLWSWTEEKRINGTMRITGKFSDKDNDPDTVRNKFWGRNSFWGLDQDKWNTLNNGGKMYDFSIYG